MFNMMTSRESHVTLDTVLVFFEDYLNTFLLLLTALKEYENSKNKQVLLQKVKTLINTAKFQFEQLSLQYLYLKLKLNIVHFEIYQMCLLELNCFKYKQPEWLS